MPVMNGYEATKIIKARQSESHNVCSKIIALTASSFEEDKVKMLDIGCDDFLRKPFHEHDIFKVLERHLRITFVYEQQQEQAVAPTVAIKATEIVTRLKAIPRQQRRRLEEAALVADIDKIDASIEKIRSHQPALATVLTHLANAFDYMQIVTFIQEANNDQTPNHFDYR